MCSGSFPHSGLMQHTDTVARKVLYSTTGRPFSPYDQWLLLHIYEAVRRPYRRPVLRSIKSTIPASVHGAGGEKAISDIRVYLRLLLNVVPLHWIYFHEHYIALRPHRAKYLRGIRSVGESYCVKGRCQRCQFSWGASEYAVLDH